MLNRWCSIKKLLWRLSQLGQNWRGIPNEIRKPESENLTNYQKGELCSSWFYFIIFYFILLYFGNVGSPQTKASIHRICTKCTPFSKHFPFEGKETCMRTDTAHFRSTTPIWMGRLHHWMQQDKLCYFQNGTVLFFPGCITLPQNAPFSPLQFLKRSHFLSAEKWQWASAESGIV